MSDVIEVTGTIRTPFLPLATHGHPRLSIEIKSADNPLLGGCSTQVTGLSLPFRVYMDRGAMTDETLITFEATCEPYTGSDSVAARLTRTVSLAEATGAPVTLELQAQQEVVGDQQAAPAHTDMVELRGQVVVPGELRHDGAYLGVTLYVEQEDGESNLYSSNLSEHGLTHSGGGAPFALSVDPATLPEGRPVTLNVVLYDRGEDVLLAAASVPHLDLDNPPDLSALVLAAGT